MKKFYSLALILAAVVVVAAAVKSTKTGPARDTKATVALGAVVADFTLPDADGRDHSLASLKGSKGTVLIFVATKCPVSNAYNERMQKLAEDYASRGVNVVGHQLERRGARARSQAARGGEGLEVHHP
jgi:cytochrome oxidase Cu insertion factor (SCO1/SenC/PrrC family)